MSSKTLSGKPVRNIQFTKLIKAGGSFREFNFRKAVVEGKIVFYVDVTDDKGARISFQLEQQNDSWKIIPLLLPSWINEVENFLHDSIEQELD